MEQSTGAIRESAAHDLRVAVVSALLQFVEEYLERPHELDALLASAAGPLEAPAETDAVPTARSDEAQSSLAERVREQNKEYRVALAECVGSAEAERAFDSYLDRVEAVRDYAAEHGITVGDSEPPPASTSGAERSLGESQVLWAGRADDERPLGP
jgi:hypothetical protein